MGNSTALMERINTFVLWTIVNLPKVVDISHPVYKAKKKETLLSDYKVGEKVKVLIEPSLFDHIPDIDDDEMPF